MNLIPQPPLPDLSMPWWFDLLIWLPPVVIALSMVWIWRRAYSSTGVLARQTAYLDHQKQSNEKVIAQNKAFEDLIAMQNAETNRRADAALAMSAEALRLHQSAVEELRAMNAMLAQVAGRGAAG